MNARPLPTLNDWYLDTLTGASLEVFFVDDSNSVIDVQDEDGAVYEVPMHAWLSGQYLPILPPAGFISGDWLDAWIDGHCVDEGDIDNALIAMAA